MDYKKLAQVYQPKKIGVLLVGEAPPPSGKKYFYFPPPDYKPVRGIADDAGLPATIFNHYFGKRPANSIEYVEYLSHLKKHGIFLIDMYPFPENFRRNKDLRDKLFNGSNMMRLQKEINLLAHQSTKIIFLLARNYQAAQRMIITKHFPSAIYEKWKDFRLNTTEILPI